MQIRMIWQVGRMSGCEYVWKCACMYYDMCNAHGKFHQTLTHFLLVLESQDEARATSTANIEAQPGRPGWLACMPDCYWAGKPESRYNSGYMSPHYVYSSTLCLASLQQFPVWLPLVPTNDLPVLRSLLLA